MLCIIRGRSSAVSGCLLNDFGESSFDDTVSDRDTLSDCSVRYFCESASSDYPVEESPPTPSNPEATNMAEGSRITVDEEVPPTEDEFAIKSQSSIDNTSLMLSTCNNESVLASSTLSDAGQCTVDEMIDHIGFGAFQVKLMLVAGLCWMADGSEMMLLSILSPTLKCLWSLSSFQEAIITMAVFFGLMVGSGFWGFASDKYGRKKTIILSTLCVLYFGILSSQSPSYGWIVAIRLFVGIGIGGVPQAVTVVSEFLPTSSRGRCIVLLQLFWSVGSIFAVVLALVTVNSIGWRWYLALITVPLFIFLVLCKLMPESPRYLIASGRKDEALEILRGIAKKNNKELPSKDIVTSQLPVSKGKVTDLFVKEYRSTTALVWAIWFTSAFAYYGIVLLATEMFQTGIDACHPSGRGTESAECGCFLLTTKDYTDFLWTTVAEVPGILLTLPIIELIGRKKTLAFEFLASAVFFLMLLICINRTAEVVFMFGVRAFVTGAFQAAYVYTPEVFPTNVRALGLGTSSAFARIGAMLTPFVAQVLLKTSLYATVGCYAVMLIFCCVAAVLLPIETKGRALEETTSMSVSYHKDGYDRLH